MKLDLTKKVSFEGYGEEWKDCYIEFYMPSYKDVQDFSVDQKDEKEATNKAIEKLKSLFKGGKGISDGKVVELTAEDIVELPIEYLTKCFKAITGDIDPKA